MNETCTTCGAAPSTDLAWCGRCFTPFATDEKPAGEIVIVMPAAGPPSILDGGSASFGLVGKCVVTLMLGTGAILGVGWAQTWLDMGRPLQALAMLLGVAYAALAAITLRWTWRPERRAGIQTEKIVLIDAAAEVAVERRHEALAKRP